MDKKFVSKTWHRPTTLVSGGVGGVSDMSPDKNTRALDAKTSAPETLNSNVISLKHNGTCRSAAESQTRQSHDGGVL